jgi:hypothetical protein
VCSRLFWLEGLPAVNRGQVVGMRPVIIAISEIGPTRTRPKSLGRYRGSDVLREERDR